jgi:hypothetical protein
VTADSGHERPKEKEPRRNAVRRADRPVLPDVSQDELDVGWGDAPSERDDDWYRRERPPHHE